MPARSENVKREWNGMRKYDVCFLVSVQPPSFVADGAPFHETVCAAVESIRLLSSH